MSNPAELVFFLGGYDLEMVTIRDLLLAQAPGRFHDEHLAWGAKASAYAAEIEAACRAGAVSVLIELTVDITIPSDRLRLVDHHNERAGRNQPTSLEQVFELLQLPSARWTRWFELVAANDRGHVRGMLELASPATSEELQRVRAADRAAQGITIEQEQQAAVSVARARVLAGGALTVVNLAHDRATAVTDQMEPALGGRGYENLIVYPT